MNKTVTLDANGACCTNQMVAEMLRMMWDAGLRPNEAVPSPERRDFYDVNGELVGSIINVTEEAKNAD